ncbi:MAG: hypothetical protein Q7S61_00455 [bacterium]|nr:hypothetical protein [bacterium]
MAEGSVPQISRNEILRPTAEMIASYANSPESKRRQTEFLRAKEERRVLLIDTCSDARTARILAGFDMAFVSSIAGAIRPEYYRFAYGHPGFPNIIVATHTNGVLAEGASLKDLEGCGGLEAFQLFKMNGNVDPADPLEKYAVNEVKDGNPILQAYRKAYDVADIAPDKTVFMGVINHLTGKLDIFGVMKNESGRIGTVSAFLHGLTEEALRENKDIPLLTPDMLQNQGMINELMRINEKNAAARTKLVEQVGNLAHHNEIQDPPFIYIASYVHPITSSFAEMFDDPNIAFRVRVPKQKEGKTVVTVDTEIALAQASYAMGKNVRQDGPFDHTQNILIYMDNVDFGDYMAEQVKNLKDFPKWREMGGQVFVVDRGNVNNIKVTNHE